MRSLLPFTLLFVINVLVAQNVSYSPLYTSASFDAKTVNLNLTTGVTPGEASTLNGSATYSIPIAVPPGTNGVSPTISLTYNSSSGDGQCGYGWGISGLSAIVRTGNTVYYDAPNNISTHVKLNTEDKFALDGQRLILKTGVYGLHGSEYGTEIEGFANITGVGTSYPNPVQYFYMRSKDGTLMFYGNTADSKVMAANNTTIMYWRLNKIEYPDGNYIEFKYLNTDNESRLDEINYTGNVATGLLPYNKIKFNYAIRSDLNSTHLQGNLINSKYLVTSVVVTAENSVHVKTYEFKYGQNASNNKSLLIEVTERGADLSNLNSTVFLYQDSQGLPNSNIVPTSFAGNFNARWISADVNGDGRTDLVSLNISTLLGTFNGYPFAISSYSSFTVYLKDATGSNYTLSTTVTFPTPVIYTDIPFSFDSSDFNGDGTSDLVLYNISGNKLLGVYIYYSPTTGSSYSAPAYVAITNTSEQFLGNGKFIIKGDFNGDGITDLIANLKDQTSGKARILLGGTAVWSPISYSGSGNFLQNDWSTSDDLQVIDFNGDGKDDVMMIKDLSTQIFTFNSLYSAQYIYSAGFPTKYHMVLTGDFNGDRKTDLLVRVDKNNIYAQWNKATSTGTSFVETPFTFQYIPEINSSFEGHKIYCTDFNGDGLGDVLTVAPYSNFMRATIYRSSGNVFLAPQEGLFYSQQTNYGITNSPNSVLLGDPNGDGMPDLIHRMSSATQTMQILSYSADNNMKMLKSKDGSSRQVEWTYTKGTDATVYTKGPITTYPVNNIQVPNYLVKDMKYSNGLGGMNTKSYTYESLKIHRTKGMLGYFKVSESDITGGTKTTTELEFNATYGLGLPKKTSVFNLSNNALLEETTITNDITPLGTTANRRLYHKVTGSTAYTAYANRTVTSSFTYDDYGYITNSTVNNAGVETIATVSTYGAYLASTIPARLTSQTVTVTRTGETPYSSTTNYTYTSKLQRLTKTDFHSQPQAVTTTYEYNQLGNVTKETISAAGITSRSTTMVFDPKGRYAIETFDALNQKSAAAYDVKWGKPVSTTSIDNQTTTYLYDGFGRLISTTTPTTANSTVTFGWDINAADKTVHYVRYWIAGKPDQVVYFDLLGRQVKKTVQGFGTDGWITEKSTYDAKGDMITQTRPYKSTETPFVTTFEYFSLPTRLKKSTDTYGSTQMAYTYATNGNLTTIITSPAGYTKSNVTDAAGKQVSATDNGGTLTYTYFSHGNLRQVNNGATILVKNTFDNIYARQTKLEDINAGSTDYVYNALGQLVSQTTAMSQTSTMVYDLLGRVTSRTGPEGTTNTEYFPYIVGNSSSGKTKKITGFSGELTEYTYDSFGRLLTEKVTVDAAANTTTYAYNTFNDITSVLYPTGVGYKNFYNFDGYVTQVKNFDETVTLFTPISYNGLGQTTSYSMGNGKTTTNTYTNGIPTNFSTPGVQNLTFNWNYLTGNLTSRIDHLKSKTENFLYDNLDRLTSSTVTGATAITVGYAANGNITTKTGAGTFNYASSKINAVTGITGSSLPTSQQTITYTPYFQPSQITEGANQLNYTYASNQQRIKGVSRLNGSITNTRYYFGGFEKNIPPTNVATNVHYIPLSENSLAIVVQTAGVNTIYYAYTDYLNSILAVTNNAGALVAEQNFDAWGRSRNVTTWAYAAATVPSWLYRGYTGHEHMPQFGLVNMNGRLYDPQVGRLLSVDNYTHTEQNTQGYNRYSYAHNNPLKYTDPDGEHPVIFLAIGTVMLGARMMQGKVETTGQFVIGMASVFIMPTVGSFAGGMVSKLLLQRANTGFLSGLASGATSGFVTGFAEGAGSAYLAGQSNIGRAGLRAGIGGAAFGGVLGGMSGGIQASNSGRDFWTGNSTEYKMRPLYFASVEPDQPYINDDVPSNATLANSSRSKNNIYYKSDNGLFGINGNRVRPGHYVTDDIDGIITPLSLTRDAVYRVPGTGGTHFVRANGEINRISGWSILDDTRGYPRSYDAYGWVERDFFIQNGIFDTGDATKGQWRTLFEMISIYQR